jgi:threonine aldolase
MHAIDLRSDTVTVPSSDMRAFMMQAAVGDDVFGEDPTINDLQNMIAEMLGKEAALFVSSGTQANQISVNAHTQPGGEVICDYNSHIFNYESGAPAMLAGVQLHPIHGANGHPTAEQIAQAIRQPDDHYPQTQLICLENTHNRGGGTIYPIESIRWIHSLAREKNLKMHLDGARLWNAAIETGISLKEYARHFDSVSLCFSKGLGAPVGSIVVGSEQFIQRAHYYRKAYGGGMRQVGILAAACIYAVENHFERLADDHQNARLLAKGLSGIKLFNIDVAAVQTNIVIVNITSPSVSAYDVDEQMKEEGILAIPFGSHKLRFVTHLNLSRKDIEACIKKLTRIFK